MQGDNSKAEKSLQALLAVGYEFPGTHCHLARIALVTDDHTAAHMLVDHAWTHRDEGSFYAVPRILWFQFAESLLIPALSSLTSNHLGRLKKDLRTDGAHMEWDMTKVLDHLKPKLAKSVSSSPPPSAT